MSDGRCSGVCFSVEMGGGLEEGGLEIDLDRRNADDGKRFISGGRCMKIASQREFIGNGRGVQGEGCEKLSRTQGMRMMGSAL